MNNRFVPFDEVFALVTRALDGLGGIPDDATPVYLVRDLYGKVRISVSEDIRCHEPARNTLYALARMLHDALGAHGYPARDGVLFVGPELLRTLDDAAQEIRPGVHWADRLVTGGGWWTVRAPSKTSSANRFTLYSVKGGVGRTTTVAVLAWHLAHSGERVLVVDLDLESPGLSSAMLDSRGRPEFGLTDWFVEDLVGQGDAILDRSIISPAWASNLEGDVYVAPAHGLEPGEYLAKLGRVYMDSPEPWRHRLDRMLENLQNLCNPSVILLESRSGLHDIAAATVTDLGAQVLLFATDTPSTWDDYAILFQHWRFTNLAAMIREKLTIVSALTPDTRDVHKYMTGFKERSWTLFQENLYDEISDNLSVDRFSFDLNEEDAPHDPLQITWTLGLASGTSLRNLDQTSVTVAYTKFLKQFDQRFGFETEEQS